MQKLLPAQIRQIPKVELHQHLDCSVRWSTLTSLAQQLGIKMPQDLKSQKNEFLVLEPMTDLPSVLNKFLNAQKVLASELILEQIAFEAVEDAYNQNIRLLELRYAPTFIQEGHPHLTFEKIHAAFLSGIQNANTLFPVAVGLIAILQRIQPIKVNERVLDFVINNRATFIGIDLADNEESAEPVTFEKLFQRAHQVGLPITIHSGESPHPLSGQWIHDAIVKLGASRIGHGIQVMHHPSVIRLAKERNITFEVCPYSNYLTQASPRYQDHPLQNMLNEGLSVTVNSDDPGVFASSLCDEYAGLHYLHHVNEDQFKKMNQTAYRASFLLNKELFKNEFF